MSFVYKTSAIAVPNIQRTAIQKIAKTISLLKFSLPRKSVDKRIIIENGPAISNEREVIVREFKSDKKYLMKFRLSA